MAEPKIYTDGPYILGHRCARGHSGNRHYAIAIKGYAECQGCGSFVGMRGMEFASRAAAIAADREFRAAWPTDSAAAVLAGTRI